MMSNMKQNVSHRDSSAYEMVQATTKSFNFFVYKQIYKKKRNDGPTPK